MGAYSVLWLPKLPIPTVLTKCFKEILQLEWTTLDNKIEFWQTNDPVVYGWTSQGILGLSGWQPSMSLAPVKTDRYWRLTSPSMLHFYKQQAYDCHVPWSLSTQHQLKSFSTNCLRSRDHGLTNLGKTSYKVLSHCHGCLFICQRIQIS